MIVRNITINIVSTWLLSVPFFYIHIRFGELFPFNLTGPEFLQFYWLLFVGAFVVKLFHSNRWVEGKVTMLVLAFGMLRMVQGARNDKPVLYLFLSIFFYMALSSGIDFVRRNGK